MEQIITGHHTRHELTKPPQIRNDVCAFFECGFVTMKMYVTCSQNTPSYHRGRCGNPGPCYQTEINQSLQT